MPSFSLEAVCQLKNWDSFERELESRYLVGSYHNSLKDNSWHGHWEIQFIPPHSPLAFLEQS